MKNKNVIDSEYTGTNGEYLIKTFLWLLLGGIVTATENIFLGVEQSHPALFGIGGGNVAATMLTLIILYVWVVVMFRAIDNLIGVVGPYLTDNTPIIRTSTLLWIPCFIITLLLSWPITNLVSGQFHTFGYIIGF